jgi:histidine triad (HIT) family protein
MGPIVGTQPLRWHTVAACLFCEIAAGNQPAAMVYADDRFAAFLDIRPLFPGHVLVVPRTHVVTLPDLPAADIGPYFERVQAMTVAVRDATGAQGTFVAVNNVVSQSVPHLHTHVVPRTKGDGLRGFFWPRTKYPSDDEAARVAAAIRSALPG